MRHAALVAVLCVSPLSAAPVPKEKPDPLPDGAMVRLGTTRFHGPHTDRVTFSKDGKTLYATDDAATVYRWDADSGRPLEPIKLAAEDAESSLVRGDRAFVACFNKLIGGTIRVFDLPSGRERNSFEVIGSPRFHNSFDAPYMAVSGDGKRLAVSPSRATTPTVYDTATGKTLDLPPDTPVGPLHLSADGRLLLAEVKSEAEVFKAVVVDLADAKQVTELPCKLWLADVSPNGRRLIEFGLRHIHEDGKPKREDARLDHWDLTTGKEVSVLDIGRGVWGVAFVSADAVLVGQRSPKDGTTLSRWDVKAGKREWKTPVGFEVFIRNGGPTLAMSPDGSRVVVTDGQSRMGLFDVAKGERLDHNPNSHPDEVRWAALSADGKTATTVSDLDVREWDATTGELLSNVRPAEVARARFVGATNTLFLWGERNSEKKEAELIAWDRAKRKVVWRTKAGSDRVEVRAAGRVIVLLGGTDDKSRNRVEVLDDTGERVHTWECGTHDLTHDPVGVTDDAVFVGGLTNANGGRQTITRRSIKSGEAESSVTPPPAVRSSYVHRIDPSADGKTLTVGSVDGGWAVIESSSGKVLREAAVKKWYVESMATSAAGDKLLVRTMKETAVGAFEVKEKGKAWTLDANGAKPTAVALSPDGTKAVVGYRDGTALVWELK